MDTNDKNTQIHTFNKGMNTDVSKTHLSSELYRSAVNLRYTVDELSEAGELSLIEGSDMVEFEMSDEDRELYNNSIVLKTFNCRELGGAIILNDDKWSIITFEIEDNTQHLGRSQIIFRLCSEPLGEYLSVVTRYESDDLYKLYIADGKHSIMVVNLKLKYNTGDINEILSNNTAVLQPIVVQGEINGDLQFEVVQYCYRLYNKYGNSTGLSSISKRWSISNLSELKGGLDYELHESVGLRLIVPSVYNYDFVEIYRIGYKQNQNNPEIALIYNSKYIEGQTIDDLGKHLNILEISIEELYSKIDFKISPQIIESKDSRLFSANCKNTLEHYEEWKEWDATALPQDSESQLDFSTEYNEDCWRNNKGDIGFSGANVSWQLKFGKSEIGEYVERASQPLNLFSGAGNKTFKYSNTYFENDKIRTLRRDELYRYGIILYDQKGTQYPVKWVCDVRTPPIDFMRHSPNNPDGCFYVIGNTLYAVPIFMSFSVKLPLWATAYEIVRCSRTNNNKHVLLLCAVGRPVFHTNVGGLFVYNDNGVCNSGLITVAALKFMDTTNGNKYFSKTSLDSGDQRSKIFSIYSPELAYYPNQTLEYLQSGNCDIKAIAKYSTNTLRKNVELQDRYFLFPDENSNHLQYEKTQSEGFLGYSYIRDTSFKETNDNSIEYNNQLNKIAISLTSFFRTLIGDAYQTRRARDYSPYSKILIQLLNFEYDNLLEPKNTKILDSVILTPPSMSTLDKSENINIFDQTLLIDKFTFFKWNIPLIMPASVNMDGAWYNEDGSIKRTHYTMSPVGISGPCAIVKFEDNIFDHSGWISNYEDRFETAICNIYNKNTNNYGGFTEYSRNTSEYESHGFLCTNENEFNVLDGDAFLGLFECSTLYQFQHPIYREFDNYDVRLGTHDNSTDEGSLILSSYQVTYLIPMETEINLSKDFGDTYTRCIKKYISNASFRQYAPVLITNKAINLMQTKSEYMYNTGYSTEGTSNKIETSADEYTLNENCRVYYSQPKNNLEYFDSWTVFKPLDYLDVNDHFGQITDMKLFHNQLLFWQESAFGVLSVNERATVTSEQGLLIILGTGGILSNYDYISNNAGMRAFDFSKAISESAVYWYDYNTKDIYTYGKAFGSLSKQKGVQKSLLTMKLKENPKVAYDTKYNEVLFNIFSNEDENNTLVFAEQLDAFSSYYTIDFDNNVQFMQTLLLFSNTVVNFWDYKNSLVNYPTSNWYYYNTTDDPGEIHCKELRPELKYIVNVAPQYSKVFDTMLMDGRFYNSELTQKDFDNFYNHRDQYEDSDHTNLYDHLSAKIKFKFETQNYLYATTTGLAVTNREFVYKMAIPRSGDEDNLIDWGLRLRGKYMTCEIYSTSNDTDFAISHVITKFRLS